MKIYVPDYIMCREIDGEGVVLNLKTGYYFGLNEVGTRMWAHLTRFDSLEKALDSLMGEYEVSRERIEQDLLDFIEDLKGNGLVE